MKIERAWLRIIVSVVVGGIAGFAFCVVVVQAPGPTAAAARVVFICAAFLAGPFVASVLTHVLTPREKQDGYTRCGKCGYILTGLPEPRCPECGTPFDEQLLRKND